MKVGIMQPYFFPYIGYWQLINTVDKFVIYDNIQFTKRGWIRRNRILMNDEDKMISLPLQKDSDYLNVNERYLADNFGNERKKIKNQIKMAHQKAPEFEMLFSIVEKVVFGETKKDCYEVIEKVKKRIKIREKTPSEEIKDALW